MHKPKKLYLSNMFWFEQFRFSALLEVEDNTNFINYLFRYYFSSLCYSVLTVSKRTFDNLTILQDELVLFSFKDIFSRKYHTYIKNDNLI